MTASLNPQLPLQTRLSYACASLGTGSFLVVPQLFLLFFMTDLLGIPPALAALTLLLPKLWEFISDPYIGYKSDRSQSRMGRRHIFMLAGSITLSLGIALVFNVPKFDTAMTSWFYITAMYIAATTGYALFSVPYTALLGEMTTNPQTRTSTVAIRMGFLGLSLLLAAVVWPEVLKVMGGTREAYSVVGWCVGALCLGATVTTIWGTLRTPLRRSEVSHSSLVAQLKQVLNERSFVMLAVAYGIQMLAQSASSAMLAYMGKYVSPLGGNFLVVCFGVTTLASILAMPVWSLVGRSISKRTCFIYGGLVGAMGYLMMGLGAGGPTWLLIIGAACSGVGFAAGQVFGFSMLPDVVDAYQRRTGNSLDGAFTGTWVGWEKIGLALGGTVSGLVLGYFGFMASSGQLIAQPASATSAMVWLFSFIPAGLMLISLLPMVSASLVMVEKRSKD
jgi:glycoside/pentoside/hexuronide:cation symporter, GPH family